MTAGPREKLNETMTPKERDQHKDNNRYGFSYRNTADHISSTVPIFRFFQFFILINGLHSVEAVPAGDLVTLCICAGLIYDCPHTKSIFRTV